MDRSGKPRKKMFRDVPKRSIQREIKNFMKENTAILSHFHFLVETPSEKAAKFPLNEHKASTGIIFAHLTF